mgnify:FL=1|tara:strand:- start:954 stop:1337 length:384 start_codon:yes stop_codon:yes gene_type:complete
MSFFNKILGGDFMKSVSNIVDNVVTTDEERMQLKANLKEIVAKAEANAQEQVTRRWEADAKAGWLPANIRPMTLAFLTMIFVLISFFDGNVGRFTMNPMYGPIYTQLLLVVYGSYFAGRTIEKIKKK